MGTGTGMGMGTGMGGEGIRSVVVVVGNVGCGLWVVGRRCGMGDG